MEVLLQISGTLYIYFVNICCFLSPGRWLRFSGVSTCMLFGVPKSMAHVGLGAPNSRSLVRRHSFAGFLIALAAPKRPSAERRTYGGGPTGGSSASGLCDSHFLGGGLLLQARSLLARVHIAREAFVRQLRGMETSQATP
jgi:hypothetical protein